MIRVSVISIIKSAPAPAVPAASNYISRPYHSHRYDVATVPPSALIPLSQYFRCRSGCRRDCRRRCRSLALMLPGSFSFNFVTRRPFWVASGIPRLLLGTLGHCFGDLWDQGSWGLLSKLRGFPWESQGVLGNPWVACGAFSVSFDGPLKAFGALLERFGDAWGILT